MNQSYNVSKITNYVSHYSEKVYQHYYQPNSQSDSDLLRTDIANILNITKKMIREYNIIKTVIVKLSDIDSC